MALLVAVVAVVALVPACKSSKVAGEGRLDPDGRIVLTRDDQPTTVSRSRSLMAGDTIEVADGTAKVALPGGDVLELRPRAIVVLDGGPDLRSGRMLVTASGAPRTVRAAGSQVDAAGAVSLDVTLALRVSVFGGQAVIRSGATTTTVPALREASVPVVGVVQSRPLAIDRNDAWDQRLLGEAVVKEPDLESLARGFSSQVATANATSLAYYRDLLPGLAREASFQQDDIERLGRPRGGSGERFRAGDVLVGAAVALQGRRGSFDERIQGAAGFRGEGASWTLVAVDQQVPSIDALVKLVDGAVNVAPLELAAPGAPPPVVAPEPPPARATTTTTRPVRTTSTTQAPRSTPTTTTTAPPVQQAQPQAQPQPPTDPNTIKLPVDPLLDSVTDPVVNLLNNLLGNGGR